jgi:spermidine/putrescine transport system substrate-binding protein
MTMAVHPREPAGLRRRQFLRLSAYGAAAIGVGPSLLAACGGDDDGGGGGSENGVKLARPDDPATLPTSDDNAAIADGLAPESGTLKIYNYADYISPDVIAAFEEEFGVDVEYTSFISMDEAIAKLSAESVQFDLFFPTVDILGKIAGAGLLQPLNRSYLPNLTNVWDSLRDPFYDRGGVFTAPYVMWTTGIGYRIDAVAQAPEDYANPYDIFWDAANDGQTYLLEDDREVLAMAMLRADPDADINTEDEDVINAAFEDLRELIELVNVKVGVEAYTLLPEKRAWVHQAWAGDAVNAQYYLPEGESIENVGFWRPAEGGVVGSDTMAVMRNAAKPVLAHAFINFLLDADRALENYGWLGYQPPQNSLDPDTVVADGYVPAHLASTVIRPEDFETSQQLLQLSLEGERRWDDAYARFIAGG